MNIFWTALPLSVYMVALGRETQKAVQWFAVVLPVHDVSYSCSTIAQLIRCGEQHFLRCWPALPHHTLFYLFLSNLSVCLSLSVFLSQETQWQPMCAEEQEAGPAEEEYMSQSSGHQPGPAEPQLLTQRKCCQPGWAHTALPKLLRSVSVLVCVRKDCHVPFITTRSYKWGRVRGESRVRETNREGGEMETKGSHIQSSFVLQGCRGQLAIPMHC